MLASSMVSAGAIDDCYEVEQLSLASVSSLVIYIVLVHAHCTKPVLCVTVPDRGNKTQEKSCTLLKGSKGRPKEDEPLEGEQHVGSAVMTLRR